MLSGMLNLTERKMLAEINLLFADSGKKKKKRNSTAVVVQVMITPP